MSSTTISFCLHTKVLNYNLLFSLKVLSFFSARLEQHPDQTLSVGVVLDVIKQGTLQWPKDRLKVKKES